MYINDIARVSEDCEFYLYADDTSKSMVGYTRLHLLNDVSLPA